MARNANRAQRREGEAQEADQQRMPPPHNLIDAFDRVGDRQVFKTPAANMAIVMANLDRLLNTPDYLELWKNIKAHLTAAMAQTV